MSLELIRQAVVTAVEAAKVGFSEYSLVIEYDNVIIVDTATQQDPFLIVKIKVIDGKQIDLSDHPTHRYVGQIEVSAASKEGDGSAKVNRLLEWFYPKLHKNSFGGVRTYMATFGGSTTLKGWVYKPVIIPFWFDRTY